MLSTACTSRMVVSRSSLLAFSSTNRNFIIRPASEALFSPVARTLSTQQTRLGHSHIFNGFTYNPEKSHTNSFMPKVSLQFSRSLSFESAVDKLKQVKEVDNSTKLQLYALYKQATTGKNTTSKPGMMDFVGKAKWDAWTKLGDMKKEDAGKEYSNIVQSLLPKGGEGASAKGIEPKSAIGLTVTVKDGIRTILYDRPEKFNALTREMYEGIRVALVEANDDENTKIVVLTGSGKFYCSGNDLSQFGNITDVEEAAESGRVILLNYIASYINLRKPLIALVNGPAVGVSVTVLGLCDAVYCSDRSTFTSPFSALGQSPEGCSSYTFPRIMGYAKASELLFFNAKITAKQAYDWGLVSEVIPDDRFQVEAWNKVKQIVELPLKSLLFSKELVRGRERETLHKVNDAECTRLKERWTSDDFMQAILKFMTRKSSKM